MIAAVLDAARFKQGNGANEAGFVGRRTKKLLEVRAIPSSVPARKELAAVKKRGTRHLRSPPPKRSDTIQPFHQIARYHEIGAN